MYRLDPTRIRYLVVHTAAADASNIDVGNIRRWHLERGWSDIGYHHVIVDNRHDQVVDGTLQQGRNVRYQGAHCRGINNQSIGICCTGHGDVRPFTRAQLVTLLDLCERYLRRFDLPADAVIGHREINRLIDEGAVNARFRTTKTCPGTQVDMDVIRSMLRTRMLRTQ